jgi:hypothetical protein
MSESHYGHGFGVERRPGQENGAALAGPARLLDRVESLLRDGHPRLALDLLSRTREPSAWATNATGVCLLRLGEAARAIDVFRGLVLGAGGVVLRPGIPTVFITNYATALLLADNVVGCLRVLDEIGDQANPAVQKLRAAIRRWKDSLAFWQKFHWYTGGRPDRPVTLEFSPGDLA